MGASVRAHPLQRRSSPFETSLRVYGISPPLGYRPWIPSTRADMVSDQWQTPVKFKPRLSLACSTMLHAEA